MAIQWTSEKLKTSGKGVTMFKVTPVIKPKPIKANPPSKDSKS